MVNTTIAWAATAPAAGGGRFTSLSRYRAEHARQGGFPANRVSEVKAVIDPTTAEG